MGESQAESMTVMGKGDGKTRKDSDRDQKNMKEQKMYRDSERKGY